MGPEELRQTATEYIRRAVALGRQTCAGIVSDTVEHLHGYGTPADLTVLAWQIVPAEFAAHLQAQSTWPERTDNDRLTDAFRALDAAGIVARQDFTCCQNCGTTDIGGEVLDAAPARGYVFYHAQDAERAAAGDGVWLAYGRFEQPPTEQIGAEVATALRTAGLPVEWDGSPGQRIHVPMRWARRRHGRMAAYPVGDPAEPIVSARFTPGAGWQLPAMSAAALAHLELPWLPEGTSVQVGQVELRRIGHRLVRHDGRVVGRFDGLRLLRGEGDDDVPREPGLIEVAYCGMPTGVKQYESRPMDLPEILDALRRLPTRTDSWLSAMHDTAGCVQMRWENGQLWLETPDPAEQASTGKYATLDEAEQVLTILSTEHRNGVAELDDVTTTPW